MALIEAGGLGIAQATSKAKGSIETGTGGLAATSVLCDAVGNLDVAPPAFSAVQATCLAQFVQEVKVASAEAISTSKIRITFDRGMKNDAALKAVGNYLITPQSPGAASLYLSGVTPENKPQPTFVEIETSEMTNGAVYLAEVSPIGPTDPEGVPVDAGNNSDSLAGIGDSPTVKQVIPISKNRVDVIFTENMKDNLDIRDPDNYEFDNGLLVLQVLDMEADTVKLVTSDQQEGLLYTLEVKEVKKSFFGSLLLFNASDIQEAFETGWADAAEPKETFSGTALQFDVSENEETFKEFVDAGTLKTSFSGSILQFDTAEDEETFDEWTGVEAPFVPDANAIVLAHLDDVAITTLQDDSGNNYDGGPYQGTNTIITGKWGNGVRVHDKYSGILFPATGTPIPSANFWDEGTIEFMFKPDNVAAMAGFDNLHWIRLVPDNGSTDTGIKFRIGYWSGRHHLEATWKWGSTIFLHEDNYDPATDFTDGVWHPMKLTWSKASSEFKMYINGVLKKSGTGSNEIPDTYGFKLYVGQYGPGATTKGMPGYYDEIRYSDMVR